MSAPENNGGTTGGVTRAGFKPGQSGNPGGRPKLDPEVRELLNAPNTVARVRRLEELSRKAEEDGDYRTAAHIELALLKKTLPDLSAMELTGEAAPAAAPMVIDIKRLSTEELRFLIRIQERQARWEQEQAEGRAA